MAMLQNTVLVQNRVGSGTTTAILNVWWGNANAAFDPRVVYDPYANRWIATAGGNAQQTNSQLLVAVSKTADPNGPSVDPAQNWYQQVLAVDPGQTNWADFPQVGFSKDWIVVTANIYKTNCDLCTNSGDFQYAKLWVFNKTNLYAGGTTAPTILKAETSPPQAYALAPSLVYDPAATNMFLATVWTTNALRIYKLSGPLGSETLVAMTNMPAMDPTNAWSPDFGKTNGPLGQSGTNSLIFAADHRFLAPVIQRNGSLFCAHHIFLPYNNVNRTAVQAWQISLPDCLPSWAARLNDTSGVTNYAYPGIAVNKYDDAFLIYSRFSTNQYPSANYAFHDAFDPPGVLRDDTVLQAGQGPFTLTDNTSPPRIRWGDFPSAAVDPVDQTTSWLVAEYSTSSNSWATWWGQVVPQSPGNDYFTNAYSLSGASGTTNGNNMRATGESGEPHHAGNTNTGSVWYTWTPPSAGNVIIDATGSNSLSTFTPILAAYTGTSVSALTLVTNDVGSAGPNASRIVFNAAASTTYRVAVDGANTSGIAGMGTFVLDWNRPTTPVFVMEPLGLTRYVGQSATFTTEAVGNPSASYQWRFNGGNISGATASSYTISSVTTNNAGNYAVVANNTSGSVTSVVAVLTVATTAATLSSPVYANGEFSLTVSMESGLSYAIQANTNIATSQWTSLKTNVAPFTLTDTAASNYPQRFYRAVYWP
jgi:Ig-like domain-containing protein